jgi:hypothetical protein
MKSSRNPSGLRSSAGAWPAATLATNLLGRFEKAHPIDLAQRAQRAKTGFPFRMKRR